MKKLLTLVMLLACSTAWAQDVVRDSVPATVTDTSVIEENVIGTKPTARTKSASREANLLGAPVYYDLNGNVIGATNPSPVYHRPKHHYLNNLNDRYCSIFTEGEVLDGSTDKAFGLNFTYLPKRWGAYGSALIGVNHDYLSVGPALRLSGYESYMDWQLYGGLMLGGRSVGGEVGIRLASAKSDSEFCMTSVSLGCAIVGGHSFITFGASVEILALIGAATFLFW